MDRVKKKVRFAIFLVKAGVILLFIVALFVTSLRLFPGWTGRPWSKVVAWAKGQQAQASEVAAETNNVGEAVPIGVVIVPTAKVTSVVAVSQGKKVLEKFVSSMEKSGLGWNFSKIHFELKGKQVGLSDWFKEYAPNNGHLALMARALVDGNWDKATEEAKFAETLEPNIGALASEVVKKCHDAAAQAQVAPTTSAGETQVPSSPVDLPAVSYSAVQVAQEVEQTLAATVTPTNAPTVTETTRVNGGAQAPIDLQDPALLKEKIKPGYSALVMEKQDNGRYLYLVEGRVYRTYALVPLQKVGDRIYTAGCAGCEALGVFWVLREVVTPTGTSAPAPTKTPLPTRVYTNGKPDVIPVNELADLTALKAKIPASGYVVAGRSLSGGKQVYAVGGTNYSAPSIGIAAGVRVYSAGCAGCEERGGLWILSNEVEVAEAQLELPTATPRPRPTAKPGVTKPTVAPQEFETIGQLIGLMGKCGSAKVVSVSGANATYSIAGRRYVGPREGAWGAGTTVFGCLESCKECKFEGLWYK